MNWPAIFLGCFVIGFMLSALSFALGAMHAHLHIHVPWGHHIHGNVFHGSHLHGGQIDRHVDLTQVSVVGEGDAGLNPHESIRRGGGQRIVEQHVAQYGVDADV